MLQKLNELNPMVKIVIALVIVAVIVAGGYYGLVQSVQAANVEKHKQWDDLKAKHAKLADFQTKVNQLDRDIAALKQQMELQKKIVPDEKETDSFIKLLQTEATAAGVGFRHLTSKPIATKEYYVEVPFDIEIDGPYYSVLNFFERLSRQERIVNVADLKMVSLARGSKYPVSPGDSVTVACTTKTFYSREAAAAAAPAKK